MQMQRNHGLYAPRAQTVRHSQSAGSTHTLPGYCTLRTALGGTGTSGPHITPAARAARVVHCATTSTVDRLASRITLLVLQAAGQCCAIWLPMLLSEWSP